MLRKRLMMYRISPACKKCLVETSTYEKEIDGVMYKLKEIKGWRSGSFTVEASEERVRELKNQDDLHIVCGDEGDGGEVYEFEESFDCYDMDYELYDENGNSIDDGDVYDTIMEIIEESGMMELEDTHGWVINDTEYDIYGETQFELLEE